MFDIVRFGSCALLIGGSIQAVQADYGDTFPSDDSTVVSSVGDMGSSFGYFWSVGRGDLISETFVGTGLDSVIGLDLGFEVADNVLNSGASVDWDVLVNGVSVGGWSWMDGDGTGPVALSYSFAPIAGAGTYTVAMEVINEVPAGQGSITIGYPGKMLLRGGKAVPDSGATLALFGSALLLLQGLKRWRVKR